MSHSNAAVFWNTVEWIKGTKISMLITKLILLSILCANPAVFKKAPDPVLDTRSSISSRASL